MVVVGGGDENEGSVTPGSWTMSISCPMMRLGGSVACGNGLLSYGLRGRSHVQGGSIGGRLIDLGEARIQIVCYSASQAGCAQQGICRQQGEGRFRE